MFFLQPEIRNIKNNCEIQLDLIGNIADLLLTQEQNYLIITSWLNLKIHETCSQKTNY